MPPYKVFALDHWIQQYAPKCKVTLHDSMVTPLTLSELQAFDPAHPIISQNELLTYAGARGKLSLRENIALLYESLDRSTTFDPDNILVTSGAISANQLVLETLLSPGDRVIVQHPTFNQLVELPRRAGASVTLWRQHQREVQGDEFLVFKLDVDELETLLDEIKPRMLIVNNPSNPTGALLTKDELERIIELCVKRNVLILCDEVFRFLHHDDGVPQPPSILQLKPKNCIVVSSISKSFALPGVRVGWIAVTADIRETILRQFGQSSDYTTIAVGCVDQEIAEFSLRPHVRDQILQRSRETCRRNIDVIRTWAARNKDLVTFFRPVGAGTCLIKVQSRGTEIDDVEFIRKLVEIEKVFAPPAGTCFGDEADGSGGTEFKGFLRVGTGMETDKLQTGLEAIERLCGRWSDLKD